MSLSRWIGALTALVLMGTAAAPAAAQEKPVTFDFRGGIGVPAGDLSDAADPGAAFNVGANFLLAERFSLRVEGGAQLHPGAVDLEEELQEGINSLSIDLIHFHGGLRYHALQAEQRGWFVDLGAGAGFSNLNIPRVEAGVGNRAVILDVSEIYFSANGGATAGYRLSDAASLFVDGQAYFVFADEDDTRELADILGAAGQQASALGTIVDVPLTAGVRFHF